MKKRRRSNILMGVGVLLFLVGGLMSGKAISKEKEIVSKKTVPTEKETQSNIAQLKNSSDAVVLKAQRELVRIGKPAVPFLIKALKKKSNAQMRKNICQILERIRDERARETLIKRLKDRDVFVRLAAASALIALRDKSGIPVCLKALKKKDVKVRRLAIRILGRSPDSQICTVLKN